MSSVEVAGLLPVAGPVPRRPEYGLLSVALPIAEERWRAGANLDPYPSVLPSSVDPCAEGTLALKDTPEAITLPDGFRSARVYVGEICSAMGTGVWEAFKERANDALRAAKSWALERQLVAGEFSDTLALNAPGVSVLNAGAPTAVRVAIAYLEDAIAATARAGIIHLTPSAASSVSEALDTDGEMAVMKATGTRVVVGQGYRGAAPPDGHSQASAGASWIYATHDVLAAATDDGAIFALPESLSEALDRELNEVIYRAELDLLVAFDPALRAAVNADWSP